MEDWQIDYESYLLDWSHLLYEEMVENLIEDLTIEWAYHYRTLKGKFEASSDIVIIKLLTFEYLYDCKQILVGKNEEVEVEARTVVAYGRTNPAPNLRDDARLKWLLGSTEKNFGKEWDKGHFIANSIGGRVLKHEVNVFPQLRRLNRGWSKEGKVFRSMERYCSQNQDIFCFHRPIYLDLSIIPTYLEFGILLPDGTFWIELFNNTVP